MVKHNPEKAGPVQTGDDRLNALTRWVSILITPFLVGAFIILYFFPTRTADLFAWPINPPMSALFIGAGFGTGAAFFVRALAERRWHAAAPGFLPVAAFALLMALTTVLHWDRFSHAHPAFIAWAVIYAATPILVPLVWLHNRRADPGDSKEEKSNLPRSVRLGLGLFGAAILVVGLCLFINPQTMMAFWPWALTPLTARATISFIILAAGSEIMLARERRWSAYRLVIQGQVIGLGLTLLAVPRAVRDFSNGAAGAWTFSVVVALLLLVNLILYIIMEARARRG